MSSWRFLGLERPRAGSRFRLKDRIMCSLGLALGVFFLLLSWGFVAPIERIVKKRILGTLPDRMQVAKKRVSMGPVAFGGKIDQKLISAVERLEGVEKVYRQAHFPGPCQLRARYGGESLVTDLVLEMVDEGLVENDVASGYEFKKTKNGEDVPVIVPRAILDLINSGISVNTSLPQLTESAIVGKHFDLYMGHSSFRPGVATKVRCTIVGVSDQIGAGGPAIPYSVAKRHTKEQPLIHVLTLKLENPEATQELGKKIESLGLAAPRQELAEKVTSLALVLKLFASLLPLAVLSVTALALGAVLELQVSRERQTIALYRAVGATRKQITWLYLTRAWSVALVSLVLGTLSALLVGVGLASYLEQKLPPGFAVGEALFSPPLMAYLLSILFCFALTAIAGWYPARRASMLEPAQIFREP